MNKFALPESISAILRNRFPKQAKNVIAAHSEDPNQFIRLNPNKSICALATQSIKIEDGIYQVKDHSFIEDPDWHSGSYYVQEANSMWTGRIFKQEVLPNLPKQARILDTCAAPGGKSTHIASLMRETDILISNEIDRKRFQILVENMSRWGNPNVICTHADPALYAQTRIQFDFINIDAPCSGQGLMRKMPDYASSYTEERIEACSIMQKNILQHAAISLKTGGYILYSTCTFCSEENDGQIQAFLETHTEFEVVKVEGVIEGIETDHGWQFLPGISKGEGFYFCLLKKEGELIETPSAYLPEIKELNAPKWVNPEVKFFQHTAGYSVGRKEHIQPILSAINALPVKGYSSLIQHGYEKGRDIIPTHLASYQNRIWNPEYQVDIGFKEAQKALKKEAFEHNCSERSAIYQIQFNDNGILNGKFLGNRFNNYMPEGYRIKKVIGNK